MVGREGRWGRWGKRVGGVWGECLPPTAYTVLVLLPACALFYCAMNLNFEDTKKVVCR